MNWGYTHFFKALLQSYVINQCEICTQVHAARHAWNWELGVTTDEEIPPCKICMSLPACSVVFTVVKCYIDNVCSWIKVKGTVLSKSRVTEIWKQMSFNMWKIQLKYLQKSPWPEIFSGREKERTRTAYAETLCRIKPGHPLGNRTL